MGNKNTNPNTCIFCTILQQNTKILHQNNEYFAFHDLSKGSAQQHILVCPKTHVKNSLHFSSPEQVQQMRQFGIEVLNMLFDQNKDLNGVDGVKGGRRFRVGFHLPPFIGVNHVHLHCVIQPIQNCFMDKVYFGWLLHSPEDVKRRIQSKNQKNKKISQKMV